jgi:VIT1/CCC1 family predicted Fe2+/Mn2+ transporter
MGLGGSMAGRTDIEHFASERVRGEREVSEVPHKETAEVHDILRSHGLNEADAARVAKSIKADKKRWVDFMMRFELGLEEPDPKQAGRSALTISLAYIAGGLIPLAPYFFFGSVQSALLASVLVTLLALFVFGSIKGMFTTGKPTRSAIQTVVVGGLAASAAFLIARALG